MNKCQEKDQIQEAKLNPENSNHIMEYGKLCLSISMLGQCYEQVSRGDYVWRVISQ